MSAEYTLEIDRHGTKVVRVATHTVRRRHWLLWRKDETVVGRSLVGAFPVKLEKVGIDRNLNRPAELHVTLNNGISFSAKDYTA